MFNKLIYKAFLFLSTIEIVVGLKIIDHDNCINNKVFNNHSSYFVDIIKQWYQTINCTIDVSVSDKKFNKAILINALIIKNDTFNKSNDTIIVLKFHNDTSLYIKDLYSGSKAYPNVKSVHIYVRSKTTMKLRFVITLLQRPPCSKTKRPCKYCFSLDEICDGIDNCENKQDEHDETCAAMYINHPGTNVIDQANRDFFQVYFKDFLISAIVGFILIGTLYLFDVFCIERFYMYEQAKKEKKLQRNSVDLEKQTSFTVKPRRSQKTSPFVIGPLKRSKSLELRNFSSNLFEKNSHFSYEVAQSHSNESEGENFMRHELIRARSLPNFPKRSVSQLTDYIESTSSTYNSILVPNFDYLQNSLDMSLAKQENKIDFDE